MTIFKGIFGLGKVGFGIDKAPASLIHQRRVVCSRCPEKIGPKCIVCRCYLVPKTRIRGEKCPRGYW